MEGLPPHLLVGFLFVLEQRFKPRKLRGHVAVDFEVARDDFFHLANVVVHVLVYNRRRLHARDNLALLSQQLGGFLQVLQVVFLKLFVLFKDVVDLLVERQQVVVHYLHALTSI